MIKKNSITETLLQMKVGSTITENENYKTFLEMKSRLKARGLGAWKIKSNFNKSFDIYRVS